MTLRAVTVQEFDTEMIEYSWFGCYRASWNAAPLHPDAYSHPAKVSFGLAERIYKHLLEQGYIKPGAVVADPFGGIAGFAFHALMNGLHWKGVELEEKFCTLGNQNIELWRGRYAVHFQNYGSAVLVQGDSRELCKVLGRAGAVVSSPPYASGEKGHPSLGSVNKDDWGNDGRDIAARRGVNGKYSDSTPGQLGSMKEGDISAVISSPPYSDAVAGNGEGPGARFDSVYHSPENATKKSSDAGYGGTAFSVSKNWIFFFNMRNQIVQ
jgi:hypothetical protein